MGKRILFFGILAILLLSSSLTIYLILNKNETIKQYSAEEKVNILDLIESRNTESYRQYLNDGRKLSFTFPDGHTPLEKLIHNNDFNGAEKILETGFDLNLIKDANPIEILTQIIAFNEGRNFGQVDTITTQLIEQVKDQIEKPDDYGYSFLINTIITDNKTMTEVVLKHIKDINKVYQGHTALTYACYDTSNLEIIKLLIDQGANVNIKGPDGDNALMNAIANESDIPQYLIQNTNIEINAQNNDGETVLHLAVENENLALIQLLLAETSIDQTIKNEDGLTAYDLAIVYRNRYGEDYLYDEIVSLLGNF